MSQNKPRLDTPRLYTFRRCPYAIRARLAIQVSGVHVEEVEVKLSDKPAAMLAISPKGTVPVLQLTDGTVIDESLHIMHWSLNQCDPDAWLTRHDDHAETLINSNDSDFKAALDRYKYPDRFPEQSQEHYRDVEAAVFLRELELRLLSQRFLCGNDISLADAAIFPFVRQFIAVDADWFSASPYKALMRWHESWQTSALFQAVMKK